MLPKDLQDEDEQVWCLIVSMTSGEASWNLSRDPIDWLCEGGQLEESVHITVKTLAGELGDWRGEVVSISDVRDVIPQHLVKGLWLEAVQYVIQDILEIRMYNTEQIARAFKITDTDRDGLLEPHQLFVLVLNLLRSGMNFDAFKCLLQQLGLNFPSAVGVAKDRFKCGQNHSSDHFLCCPIVGHFWFHLDGHECIHWCWWCLVFHSEQFGRGCIFAGW